MKDLVAFSYWKNKSLPKTSAERYVCISYVPGFWNHVMVGRHKPISATAMFAEDNIITKLFDVTIGDNISFHWCCFVLEQDIFLCTWFFIKHKNGKVKFTCLTEAKVKRIVDSTNFKSMLFYLMTWFKVQYSTNTRHLNLILDNVAYGEENMVDVLVRFVQSYGVENDYNVSMKKNLKRVHLHSQPQTCK